MSNILIEQTANLLKKQLEKVNASNRDITVPYIHFKHIEPPADVEVDSKPSIVKEDDDGPTLPHDRLPDISSGWREKNDNHHIGKDSKTITSVLKKATPKLPKHEKDAIESYTGKAKYGGSGQYNGSLLNPKKSMHWRTHQTIKDIHSATSKPLGHNINLYSGVYSDPRKWKKETDGSTRLRAFTSLSHDKKVAHIFAHQWADKSNIEKQGKEASPTGKKGEVHIIHLHAKAEDKGLHVSKHSPFDEHETVLPADTHIKPHPNHVDVKGRHIPDVHTASDGTMVHIHHYVIHKQTEAGQYKSENKIY